MAIKNGKEAKQEWGIPAEQVLYREDGTFYQLLTHFPGALADAHGYILFQTAKDYKQCPQLKIGKKIGVPRGIAGIPGYVRCLPVPSAETDIAHAVETTFGLESDLQKTLRINIQQLENGLEITDGGKEQAIRSGRIDITARDRTGTTVVIELKAGDADKNAVGQILAYMGELDAKNAKKPIRGILVAEDFRPSALAAARMVPNLELKKYGIQFSFEAAPDFAPDEE